MAKIVKDDAPQFIEKVVKLNRVTKVVKGGKNFSFNAIVVVGDGNGRVGHGLGKALEVTDAIAKGIEEAKKNLISVNFTSAQTVPHEIEAKFGAAKVLLKPAAAGTGIIAGGVVRAVLECAGYHNILSKSKGSSNAHNIVKATIEGLKSIKSENEFLKSRGISREKLYN
ncbi:MAG: 30S ribosomal protein S5 [Candidatus Delongbacteria bacterium]|nr:30S ribosomal protein S5 [Candidatus Delongbacteria bacterium]MBN2836420.1 30S ribosomal protein S5 [Candidatus Delongbacteria bacterium]